MSDPFDELKKINQKQQEINNEVKNTSITSSPEPKYHFSYWILGGIVAVLVVFFVFSIISIFYPGTQNSTENDASNESSTQTSGSNSYESEAESTPTSQETTTPDSQQWNPIYTVTKVKWLTYFDNYTPDAAFLVVRLKAENQGNEPTHFDYFRLMDDHGEEFEEYKYALSYENHINHYDNINPKLTTSGTLLFDVPKGKYYKLKIFREDPDSRLQGETTAIDLPNPEGQ